MSNGGMDGFDWLQSFLPADSQPDHDSIANIEAYQAHLAFHDSEEVAKAAVMHQQAQRSYSFMRSTNPGTNHALNPSQVYSQASGGQYRGNQDQESSNVQSNNSASGPSVYPTHRSHNISQRPNPTSPSQHQLTSRVHQDAYRHGQTHMDPADPSQRPCKSISNSLEADKSPHRAHEITRPTAPPQRTNQNMARPLPASQNPYQGYSATPNQHSQMLDQSHMGQGMTAQGQRKYTPVARPQASQSPYQSHSTIPTQNVQRSSHSHTPPSSHSMDTELYNPLVSPKGFDTSAARSTPDPRQLITPTTSTREGSNPQTQNSVTNSTRSNPIPPRPSYQNYAHVQSAVPTAPNGVQSPATSQAVSTRSPSVSIVSSDPASAPPAPPAQITTVPHHLDKGRTQEKRGTQGKAPPTSLYQAPNQTSQQPPISEPNEQSTPAASSSFASSNPPAGPHPGPSYNSSYTSGPRRGTFSESAMAQQHAARNPQSRGYPLPGPLQHQKKRWVPTQEHLSGSMPPAKIRRLDNRTTQDGTLTSGSVKGAQISMEYPRPRGPGKILKNRDDLVQPIRRSDALPKHTYDPATIARDVLIAAGKHPTEKILNHHLEGLRRNFTKIHYLADLATFRWDLVDVKQPEPQVVDRMPPVPTPQIPLRPPPHPQPPQSAWQSLPRDPDAVIPNHVTVSDFAPMPSRDTPPNRPIAMPTRIDARAPPGGLSAWGTLPFKPPTYNPPQPIYSSNLPSGLPRVDPVPASPQSSHQSVPFPASPPPQPQQRRLSTAKSADPPKPPHTAKQSTPKSTAKPKPPAQTARSQSDSSRTVKSPETRRLPQPQVVIPYSPHKMPQNQKRRPGRPHKTGANHIEVAIHREQPVNYQIFPCKWEGCAAELHNIDSVRAHLIKVHIPHSLICKWKECGNKTPMAAADMFMHVSNEHISKMAWRLGDGPTVPIIDLNKMSNRMNFLAENKPSYPSVLGDRSARKGTMVLPVDEHQVKAFSKAHGKSTEKTKAQALLEAGRHWKQQVGPEMDWSDRRLSTPARQSRIHCGEMAFVGED